ncbi:Trk system potassium transporter TrkA [Serpentinicella alkaliphila]|uniref:Trk system potassium uptake protein TrkA n=1 Tax=Serpentinicella alkaliphila TaxID=1734049 RepID=A0A4R2TPM9_9FIRM|nr:Trk system potassium transporter TrkA [Serpentinicella alkaliphila]QUH24579.1 Trk system potassium transporter TrkA [Serpentinicella alkaliphila]TCQ04677.1 trk system potassium uptake protein TrkA [Serpentinicella alkaliphila]
MQIIIVGAGKLGYKLAESLSNVNNNVIIIDNDESALERVNNNLDVLSIKANGVQLSVLEQFNIKNTDLVIAVTDSDETNMLICTMAKRMGAKRVIARIRNPEYSTQIEFVKEEMKIDYVANPDLETAKEIFKYLLKGQALHMEEFAKGKVSMTDFKAYCYEGFAGKKLKEIKMPESLLIVALQRDGEVIIPHGETELSNQDTVYVIGKKESINTLLKTMDKPTEHKKAKKVLILGGGKAGFYLAKKLTNHGVTVKIVERDKERCKYLVEQLKNTLVIHGDGTDVNLLTEENITDMDALVTLTGFDEENLLLALLSKRYGLNKVIAKVSRPNYIPIIERLGIDVAINPVLITASEILRFIQGGKVISISLLLGGQAEVLELIANESSNIVGKPLSDVGLPQGIIIGAVVHRGVVTIPSGKTIIYPGDRMIVFCLESEISHIEKYFYKVKGGLLHELWSSYKGTGKSTSI